MTTELIIQRTDFGSSAAPWDAAVTYATGDFVLVADEWWVSRIDDNVGQAPMYGGIWTYVNQYAPFGWVVKAGAFDADMTLRSIGVYAEAACTTFLYRSELFEFNRELDRFATKCPVGRQAASAAPVYYALLWGELQEGTAALIGDTNTSIHSVVGPTIQVNQQGPNVVVRPDALISPDGYSVSEIGAVLSNRIYLMLENGERDALSPTLTVALPSGVEVIPLVWRPSELRYRSATQLGIRLKLMAAAGATVAASIDWN